ncbi:flagellin [Duganella sp. 1224]|uniref:flagellin N-terminal helical domain-containing protein n=1 Tax=Duganella sp. 1224 TaxID=2587052 RepID=UPI0015CE507C|nr:flagellin [Duganella sp. 1224]NYE63224.1 flagellin [Duganella sp. 1224]
MQINTNLDSLNAQRSYTRAGADLAVHLQRLSSGTRINSARDDAAGQAIGERMTAQINGLRRATQNINDGISLVQIADGAAGQLTENYQRMRELAVQAANDTNSKLDRQSLQQEVDALVAANVDIVDGARFNNQRLLDGSFSGQLQVGARSGETVQLRIPQAVLLPSTGRGLVNLAPQQATATGTAVVGALQYGDLIINNGAVRASVAGTQAGQGADSAWALAAAVNGSAIPGITATATTTLTGLVGASGTLASGALAVNGVAVGAIAGATAAARAASAAAAISAVGNGVTASANGGTLTLTAADGRDIFLTETSGGALASLGLTPGTNKGALTITEDAKPGNHSMQIAGANPARAGLTAGAQSSVVVGPPQLVEQNISTPGEPPMDLSTHSGASDALTYLDAKLAQVDAIRADLGAMSNRLTAAAGNADNTADNLSAARSRIMDTDYATEAAQLTRTEVLSQAGAAIVAQANALPRQVLALLR